MGAHRAERTARGARLRPDGRRALGRGVHDGHDARRRRPHFSAMDVFVLPRHFATYGVILRRSSDDRPRPVDHHPRALTDPWRAAVIGGDAGTNHDKTASGALARSALRRRAAGPSQPHRATAGRGKARAPPAALKQARTAHPPGDSPSAPRSRRDRSTRSTSSSTSTTRRRWATSKRTWRKPSPTCSPAS